MKEELSSDRSAEQIEDDISKYAPEALQVTPEEIRTPGADELAAAQEPAAEPSSPASVPPVHPEKAHEDKPEAAAPKKRGLFSSLFDSLLVVMVVAVLGVAGYVVYSMKQAYPVATPLDKLRAENGKLADKREMLTGAFLQAQDERRALEAYTAVVSGMLKSPDALRNAADRIKSLDVGISRERNNIRMTDAEYKQLALSRMNGLLLGSLSTRDGKRSYKGVIVKKRDGKDLVIAHAEGMARVPIANIVQDNLPTTMRYALDLEDPLHVADLDREVSGGERSTPANNSQTKAVRQTSETLVRRDVMAQLSPTAYDPPSTGPTVDVNAPISKPSSPASRVHGPGWVAPADPLPLNL